MIQIFFLKDLDSVKNVLELLNFIGYRDYALTSENVK